MVKTVADKGAIDLELKGLSRLSPSGILSKVHSHNGYRWYISVIPKEKVVYVNKDSADNNGKKGDGAKQQRKSYFDSLSVYVHLKDSSTFSNGLKCKVSYALSVSGGKSKPTPRDDNDDEVAVLEATTYEKKFETIFKNDSTRSPKDKALAVGLKDLKRINIKDLRTGKIVFRLRILSLVTYFDWEIKGLAKQLKDSQSTSGPNSALVMSILRSGQFSYRDYKFYLEMAPCGGNIVNHTTYSMSNPNHISLNLCHADSISFSPGLQCQLAFSICIMDQKQSTNSLEKRTEACYNCSKGSHGFAKMITIEDIMKNPKGFLKGGSLIVRCKLRTMDVFYDWHIKNFSRQMNSSSGEQASSGGSNFNVHSIGGIGCFFQSQIFEHHGHQWMLTLEQASGVKEKPGTNFLSVYLHGLEAPSLTPANGAKYESNFGDFQTGSGSYENNQLTTKSSALLSFCVLDQSDAGKSAEKQVPFKFSPESKKAGIVK